VGDQLVDCGKTADLGSNSYQSVGVNEICAVAQVQKDSFYHFFPSQSDLAIAVIDHHAAVMWEALDKHERAARGPANKIGAIAEVVDESKRSLVKSFGRAVGCPLGNLAVELATTEDATGKHAAGVFARLEERVAGHCWDAAEVGQLAEGLDPDQLAHLVIATMEGMILLAKVSDSDVGAVPVAIHRAIDSCLATAPGG
jgi:TetR/AcrR family transcriptional regulator, transcriptional repressor for nem operon